MGSLDKLVQETNLDLEVISKSGSTYLNLSELEKIQRLIQMDLLDESKLLQNTNSSQLDTLHNSGVISARFCS